MPFFRVISSYNNITHNDKCILYDSTTMIRLLQRKDVKNWVGFVELERAGTFC